MTLSQVRWGSFSIERTFTSNVARVFAAWIDAEWKARWFSGPEGKWRLVHRDVDVRVGGSEVLHGVFANETESIFTARYHDIVPNTRLIYAYDMHHDGVHLSVSLASVEFEATKSGGTKMRFTEHASYLNGEDGTESRREGTSALVDRIGGVVENPREIVTSRVFDAPSARVYEAFRDPTQLEKWWGPKAFTNTFRSFDLRTGGTWTFSMKGPDGVVYDMEKEFLEVVPGKRVVILHPTPASHRFVQTLTYTDLGDRTLLTWRMAFDSEEEVSKIRAVVVEANEENLDRLAAVLAGS